MSEFILADNQDITKAGIVYLLDNPTYKEPVYEVCNKKELVETLSGHQDAIVVLDYTLFDFSNLDELLIVSARFRDAHWILLSNELSISFLRRIRLEEAFSILLKTCPKEEIVEAIVGSRNGQRYICRQINLILSTQTNNNDIELTSLTASEKEILKLIAQGKSVKEIAEERFSSVHTIITHKKNIFRKLDVNTIHEATKYALKAGLLNTMEYYI